MGCGIIQALAGLLDLTLPLCCSYIADRLLASLVASPAPDESEDNDLHFDVYRREVLLCAIWIRHLSSGRDPPTRFESDARIRSIIMDDVDATDVACLDAFLLAKGSDKMFRDTYDLAIGHRIAYEALMSCRDYKTTITNSGREEEARVTVKIVTNMAKMCTAWKRSKDRYLFQQVRTKLDAARGSLLLHLETPMAAIANQLDKSDTNRSVGRLIHGNIASICEREKWETCISIETFVICVSVLQEIMDTTVPLLINAEIPYHSTLYRDTPCFFIESGNYAPKGNRFGFVYDKTFYTVGVKEPYPIPETILGWLHTSIDVRSNTSSLEALALAIEHPESIVQSHKMSQFLT